MWYHLKLDNRCRNMTVFINIVILLIGSFYSFNAVTNTYDKPSTYQNNERYYYSQRIVLEVKHFKQAVKLFHWLDLIKLTQTGKETFQAIENSGKQLLIYHSDSALLSAGITGAPLSKNLTNGVGEDVYIKFYLDMEKDGSNCVLGKNGDYIQYTALHNLFHELIHARHKMNGTWLYFDSEGQAIREENKFRIDWANYRSTQYSLRHEFMEDESVIMSQNGLCNLAQAFQ